MPRYFFHLYDDLVSIDEEGSELPDLAAARRTAVQNVRAIACQEVLEGHLNLQHRIEVEDESGRCVLVVPFQDAVEVTSSLK